MLRNVWTVLTLLLFGPAAPLAMAHYSILLPQNWSVQRDQEITITFLWGHPFEHELFDATLPEAAEVLNPDGTRIDLTKTLEKVTAAAAGGKKVAAYRVRFTPKQRGDHVFVVTAPPLWMDSEREFWQDTVRVVVHVATQNGWDSAKNKGFELVPLTRPYGLRAGTAFQAQALLDGKAQAGALVEIERYNAEPPKELPPDEHVTRVVKTDPNGVATCTLDGPGWWCLTARRDGGTQERNGKTYPVKRRATIWIFVDAATPK